MDLKITKLELSYCPWCNHRINMAGGLSSVTPKKGDISICYYCGGVMKWGSNLQLERAEESDLKKLSAEDLEHLDKVVEGVKRR
jgi:hypothetical protein